MNGVVRRRNYDKGDASILVENPTYLVMEVNIPEDNHTYDFGYLGHYLLGTTIYVDETKYTRGMYSTFPAVVLSKGKHTITSPLSNGLKNENYSLDMTYVTYLQIPYNINSKWASSGKSLKRGHTNMVVHCLAEENVVCVSIGLNDRQYGLPLGVEVYIPKGSKSAYLAYTDSALTRSFKEVIFKYS